MTTAAITGGHGFLGWHLACRLRALQGVDPVRLGRGDVADPALMAQVLAAADTVYHLAGVNRADTEEAVESGNTDAAEALARAIVAAGRPVHVVYGNSIQAQLDNAYGRGKKAAVEILRQAVRRVGGTMADALLPNLFGEHGRPSYNSFVATFCHEVARGRQPVVTRDQPVRLMHVQAAAQTLMDAGTDRTNVELRPQGEEHLVSEVLGRIQENHELYSRGEIPALLDQFSVELFNTYRSFVFPDHFPIRPAVHRDDRGALFETVRTHGGTGQAYISTTVPGATRGEHYHLGKVERFFVVHGEAEIALRRLLHDTVVRFRLGGDEPAFVDMPTLWVHNIKNVGQTELLTVFWSDQLLDPERPDQYPERVEVTEP